MALTDVRVDTKGRSNVQNEPEHRFASYFVLLNAQEQKFDDKFPLQIESLTTQGQYLGRARAQRGPVRANPARIHIHMVVENQPPKFLAKSKWVVGLNFFDSS